MTHHPPDMTAQAAAIYARFSTDKQSETSIDDQARICRKRAEALGFGIVATHADHAVSGAMRVADRPGGRAMLADMLARRFDVLMLEGLDRLSRDRVEQETIVRRLEHRGVRIIGVSDGYDSASGKSRKILRAMRGMIDESYRDDLAEKTHRGLSGQIERGYHAGGLSFGYRSVVAGVNTRGEPIGHLLEIDTAQAEWVRWIFVRYGDGWSSKRIAHELNARGVRSARGGTWPASAIHGRADRGAGVLNNELYIGRYVWNRSQWIRDPDNPKQRERRERPREEWQIADRADLRIVSDELWQVAQRRIHAPRAASGSVGRGPRPSTLFGGLLRCGQCGGAVTAVSSRLYGCTVRKERGPTVCAGVYAPRVDLDSRLLSLVRDELLTPAALAQVQRQVREALTTSTTSRREDASRAADKEAEIGRLVDAIARMGHSESLEVRLRAAERDRDEMRVARTAATETERPSPEAVSNAYRRFVMDLKDCLTGDVAAARGALQKLLGEIRVVGGDDGEVYAEVETRTDRVLLEAVGAGVSKWGCGGPLRNWRRVRIR